MTQQSLSRGIAMLSPGKKAFLLGLTLLALEPAIADEQYLGPDTGPRAAPPRVLAYPPLLPPCTDWFWPILLRCAPRSYVLVPTDDIYLQNQLRSIPPTRRPYQQVFKW